MNKQKSQTDPTPKTGEKADEADDHLNRNRGPAEHGGFEKRPEPTRFGDWEVNGRCSDF